MLATVRKIVSIRPRRIVSYVKYFATTSHLKLGLVETENEDAQPPIRLQTHPGHVLEGASRRSLGLSAGRSAHCCLFPSETVIAWLLL